MDNKIHTCTTCKVEQSQEEFEFRIDRGKHRTTCITCRKSGQRRRYNNWTTLNPFKNKVLKAKTRSKSMNLSFNLTEEYLKSIWTGICPVYGTLLDYTLPSTDNNYPELDRTIPNLGYVIGNVAFLSKKANRLKGDGTPNDFKLLQEYLENANKAHNG